MGGVHALANSGRNCVNGILLVRLIDGPGRSTWNLFRFVISRRVSSNFRNIDEMRTKNARRVHTGRFGILRCPEACAWAIVPLLLRRRPPTSVPFLLLVSHRLIHLCLEIAPLLIIPLIHCGGLCFFFKE